jgi:hypothetical protein
MKRRVSTLMLAAAAAMPLRLAAAQTPPAPAPAPAPQGSEPPQDPVPQPPPPPPVPQPVDETKAAAEILRQRLGLKPGPQGQPPPGPPPKPPEPDPEQPDPAANAGPDTPQDPRPPAQGQPPVAPGTAPALQDPEVPQPVPQDPVKAAADAIRRMLPTAKPPAAAPMPTAAGTPEPVAPATPDQPPPQAPVIPQPLPRHAVHGVLSTFYRLRNGAGDTDQDVVARLNLNVGDAERDDWTLHFSARALGDLDGRRSQAFGGLFHDTGSDVTANVFAAHFDAHRLGHLRLLRIGRQDLDETPVPLSFDGLRADSEYFGKARVSFSGYAGVPVHQWEASRRNDSVFGLATGFVPWDHARIRLDFMSIRDEFFAIQQRDDVMGLRWWQNLQNVQLHGLHNWRDGKPRDNHVGARGTFGLPMIFQLDYRELSSTQRAAVTELDPFVAIGLEYLPFRQLDAGVSYDLADDYTIGIGGQVRRLHDSDRVSAFNREFERLHADFSVRNLGIRGLTLSFSGSVWDAGDERFRTLTGDLEYRPNADLRMMLGSSYDLFRFDTFEARERLHVRSFYLRSDYRIDRSLRLDASYEHNRDDEDTFHSFRLGLTWTF